MELPRRALNIQRALALLLLALVGAVAAVEYRSPFSARLRDSKPWPFWLSVREPGGLVPFFNLGVYDPVRRSLVLIRIPETTKLQGKLTPSRAYADALRATDDSAAATRAVEDLAQAKITALSLEPVSWEGAGRLSLTLGSRLEIDPRPADDELEVDAARALKMRGRSPRALLQLASSALRGLRAGDRAAADALLLAFELRRTPLERLEPALLPEDAAAPSFLGRTFAPAAPSADERPIVVEVLNGTDVSGLAAQASKILVSRGVDVVSKGPTPRSRLRTVVYDRTGDFGKASRVRAALGCPTAIATTRIDALRGVDVSVELGGDCIF